MQKIFKDLKDQCPLIHCITNYVTVNDMANTILAIGASPIMADELEEAGDIASISNGLVLNMGTGNKRTLESTIAAGKAGRDKGIPVVFDPVGIGASSFRQYSGRRILEEVRPNIIKGNLSEIKFLYDQEQIQKGVDSEDFEEGSLDSYIKICKFLANKYEATILMTGEVDIVSDGERIALIKNGNPTMTKITGTGCILGGVIGSFAAVSSDYFKALALGATSFALAGDQALDFIETRKLGLASFRLALIDSLSKLTYEDIEEGMKLEFQ